MGRSRPNDDSFADVLRALLYPYQERFVFDQSRFVAWVASRQIGKSHALAWRALLRGAGQPNRSQTIISAGREQAKEVISKVKAHALLLERATGTKVITADTKQSVELVNGSKVRALAANPRTARGYTGDLYLDELAHIQQDRALWNAVVPIASRGKLTITVTSTPMGDAGQFFKLCHPTPGDPFKFTLHTTTIHDAIADGLETNADALRSQFDSDTWKQEYECAFLGHVASYFPWELLRGACSQREKETEADRRARAENATTYMGVDIGRKKDLTAIVLLRKWPEDTLWQDEIEVLSKVPFDQQERILSRYIRECGVERCCIDATGMGMHLAENLQREFGALVNPVTFTRSSKVHLATQVRKALEQKKLHLTPDGALLADCHSIQRRITSSGNVVFDAARNELGHADRFWALALGTEAARLEWLWGGVSYADGEEHEWFDPDGMVVDLSAMSGRLTRAVRPVELGFDDGWDLEMDDARVEMIGARRPPDGWEADGPWQGQMPTQCALPESLTREVIQRGEDPCWTCDADRRICGGRPPRRDFPIRKPTPPRKVQVDTLRVLMAQQGYVPPTCTLDGKAVWSLVSGGATNPCAGCDADRAKCHGRAKTQETALT